MNSQHIRVLYKTILRLHRGLPCELRELGDKYVKDEFRRHKTAKPEFIAPFVIAWTNYATNLAQQIGLRGPKTSKTIGQNLEVDQLDHFEGDQIHQLYELRQSIAPGDPSNVKEEENTLSMKQNPPVRSHRTSETIHDKTSKSST